MTGTPTGSGDPSAAVTGTPTGSGDPSAALLLLAAGSGQRTGAATNKVLLPLAGRRVLRWSLDSAATVAEITRTVLVIRAADRADVSAIVAAEAPGSAVTLVVGGSTRHESEAAGLAVLADDIRAGRIDVVVIHDAARPFAGSDLFRDVIAAAREVGGALPGRPLPGLMPLDGRAPGAATGPTVGVQTPQAFRAGPLLTAYEAAAREGFSGSDTSACIERFTDLDIACLPGKAHNLKITFPEDLAIAERLLEQPGFAAEVTRSPGT